MRWEKDHPFEHRGGTVFRERRQERREERREERRGESVVRYRMREKLVAIGDDYWIEDEAGQRRYKVDGKAVRVRDTLAIQDLSGNDLARIQQKLARVRGTMDIEGADGRPLATVKKAIISPLRDRWSVSVEGGPDLEVKGNILEHEFTIEGPDGRVGEASKRWFRVADTYGIEVADGQDPVLVLAICVVVDQMAHDV
jgi:uncharacterized protein YxjI